MPYVSLYWFAMLKRRIRRLKVDFCRDVAKYILSCNTMIKTRAWIGNWFYWMLTGRNYN
jgi:hypothetical protein